MHRMVWVAAALSFTGCAVVKTTDVTDATYKRHQSVSVLGWPVYSRVTDREPGMSAELAKKREPRDRFEAPETPELSSKFLSEFPAESRSDFRSAPASDLQPAEMVEPIAPKRM